ncbi:MAG: energy-coupling factor transporter transmembrane component T, partial [bacterium]
GGRVRVRVLVLLAALFAAGLFGAAGEVRQVAPGLPAPGSAWGAATQMLMRAFVVLLAVEGLCGAVDVAEISGLLEKAGLRGIGFSLGVAMNLLPNLRQSFLNARQSLWMRGGFRARRWRGLRLLVVTVVANAIRRSQEIALAAEARAFRPDRSRPMPVKRGRLDLWLGPTLLVLALLVLVYP